MRLLLDECVPRSLRRDITGHQVSHVADLGWQSLVNGALLSRMREQTLEGFVTTDRNVEFQQNIAASGLLVFVREARTNRRRELLPLVPELLRTIPLAQLGRVYRIGSGSNDRSS